MNNDAFYSTDTYVYKVANGHEIFADVHRPLHGETRAALVWIHGGALILGSRKGITVFQLAEYLKRGYVVVAVDYRLAPETKLPEIAGDIDDAYRWVRSEGPALFDVDPRRIAIVGHSGGGYLSLLAGTRLRPGPQAIVSFYGYGTITGPWLEQPSSYYNSMPSVSAAQAMAYVNGPVLSCAPSSPAWPDGRASFYIHARQNGIWPVAVTGHNPQSEPDWFAEYEPLQNITPAFPPTMLLHGEADTDVDFEQSLLLDQAFAQQGVQHEFIRSRKWDHGFDQSMIDQDPTVQQAFNGVLEFLDRHLGN
jgi:acetyl esterase/lipase